MKISWKHDHSELQNASLEKKIEIFEEKIWGWTLHVADLMINGGRDHDDNNNVNSIPHSGFGCLQVILSYFEMIARYIEGNNGKDQSKEEFIKGFRYVFPEVDQYPYHATREFLSNLYSGGRCGLYHMAMTGRGICISVSGPTIQYNNDGKQIQLNPHKLPESLKKHLKDYCTKLRDPNERDLRTKFERRFKKDHEN